MGMAIKMQFPYAWDRLNLKSEDTTSEFDKENFKKETC